MTEETVIVAVYNIDDDTLRLSCAGIDDRFESAFLAEAKVAGYRYWRGSRQLVATWTPEREDFALRHAREIQDAVTIDDPASRAARFRGYGQNAAGRAQERQEAASQGLPPMGEPVKLDHHSAKRHLKAIQRSDQNMRAASAEKEKAQYWSRRAEAAEAHARRKEHPLTVRNRIKGLQAERRKVERRLTNVESERDRRWLRHLDRRIKHETARLAVIEPTAPQRPQYVVGEVVKWVKFGRCEIRSVGPKNCRVRILDGGARGMELRAPRDELIVYAADT
ncbi:DUF3560 domain-containing protein [Deinococcus antarcticus]|uniref:DUF3560 domain-containing protein n=1 Tax=Deinococcus antarcticus TaxID=1298767 RepID=A0ABV8ABJ1_9DEIO